MGRPLKSGLDYFPIDVELDEKFDLIEAEFGLVGFGVVIKLFQNIYKNGYYKNVTEENLLLLKKRIGVDIDLIKSIIKSCLKRTLFNQKLYDKYRILTSAGIQKRYFEATKRRKDVFFISNYLIEDPQKYYSEKVNVNINKLNDDINPENDDAGTQSKVKKSKVYNKRKKFVPPKLSDVIQFFEEKGFPKALAERAFEYYHTAEWEDSKGTKVRNWKQKMIANWLKDENKSQTTGSVRSEKPKVARIMILKQGYNLLMNKGREQFDLFASDNQFTKEEIDGITESQG